VWGRLGVAMLPECLRPLAWESQPVDMTSPEQQAWLAGSPAWLLTQGREDWPYQSCGFWIIGRNPNGYWEEYSQGSLAAWSRRGGKTWQQVLDVQFPLPVREGRVLGSMSFNREAPISCFQHWLWLRLRHRCPRREIQP
jgi:hypothetical protein